MFDTDESPIYGATENADQPEVQGPNPAKEISLAEIPNLVSIECALLLGIFLSSFDGTITSSSYPTIANEFKAVDLGSMITVSYLITVCSFQSLYGSFSEVFGRRTCLFFANSVFLVGLIGCSLAHSLTTLFFWRALTGIGGAGMLTLTTIVNSDIIPRSKRGFFQGFQNIFMCLGNVAGACLGGYICDNFGWRKCFLIQIPVTLATLVLSHMFIKDQVSEYSGRKLDRVDIKGSVLLVIGLAIQLSSLYSVHLIKFLFWFGVSSLILAAFLWNEYQDYLNRDVHHKISIVPFETLQGLSIKLLLIDSVLAGFVNLSYMFILPLLFQVVVGDSATTSGFRLAIPAAFTAVGSFANGVVMHRKVDNLRVLLPLGLFIVILGDALALVINKDTRSWVINLILMPTNLGLGLCYPALLFSFIFQFPQSMQATSTTTLFLFRGIGQVWGIAVSSAIISNLLRIEATSGLQRLPGSSLSPEEVKEIVSRSVKSLSYINNELTGEVRRVVQHSYAHAIKSTQFFAVCVGVVALAVSLVRLRVKNTKQGINF